MNRTKIGGRLATALGASLWLASAAAAQAPPSPLSFKVGDATILPFLSDRVRVEAVDWFDPGTGGGEESYAFVANVIRFGATARRGSFEATIEGQEVELLGLPDDAIGLGPGGTYFQNTADEDQRELHLRRAVLQWSDVAVKGLRLSGGRYILNDGLETTAADASLSWLKKSRISQRLIGGFEYTHTGRSFDGGSLRYARAPWDFTLAGGRPTAGGFNISANNEVEDVGILYAAVTATEPTWLPRSDGRLFYLLYTDDRGVVVTDNRTLPARQADDGDLVVHTVGANFEGVRRVGVGDVDVLVWAAGQAGQWQALDHAAWALAVEGGYRFVDVAMKPWIRAGWFRGSGDDDPNDGDHDTFFQVLPTARLYAQTPFFNMMNNEDVFVQAIVAPRDGLSVRVDYHHLWATEGDDLVYAGGGATMSQPVFGYAGYSARGHSSIADFVDVSVDWTLSPHWKLSVYYGHAFGDSVIDAQYPGGSDLDYGYFELTATL